MKNIDPTKDTARASNPPMLDKHLHPIGSGMQMGTIKTVVPWQYGIKQSIQARKIRASTGNFKNITGNLMAGTINITVGTLTTSAFNSGTVNNSQISGATINTSIFQGGTINGITSEGGTVTNGIFNNGTIGTPAITGGSFNTGVIGTPSLTGGTLNPLVYQTGGTAGASGSIVYMKTSAPTFGTLNFNAGIITSFN